VIRAPATIAGRAKSVWIRTQNNLENLPKSSSLLLPPKYRLVGRRCPGRVSPCVCNTMQQIAARKKGVFICPDRLARKFDSARAEIRVTRVPRRRHVTKCLGMSRQKKVSSVGLRGMPQNVPECRGTQKIVFAAWPVAKGQCAPICTHLPPKTKDTTGRLKRIPAALGSPLRIRTIGENVPRDVL